jgi:hypothetical protein
MKSTYAPMRASILALVAVIALFFPVSASATQLVYQIFTGGCATTSTGSANVSVNVNNPNWNAAQFIYTFNPGNIVLNGASGIDPYVGGSQAFFTLPPGTYSVDITDASSGQPHGSFSPIIVPNCALQFGSLTVRKAISNTTGRSTAGIQFAVGVACSPGVPAYGVLLGSFNNYTSPPHNIPVGSQCTLTEEPAQAPAGCHWQTAYPGNPITIAARSGYVAIVRNTLVCPCPMGQTEQTYPGTTVKFCCDYALDPNSTSFCCTREGVGPRDLNKDDLPGEKR